MSRVKKPNRKLEFLTLPGERFAYAGYSMGTNILTMLGLTFLSMFYTDLVGLTTGAVATLFLAARIWDAVNDPVFGGIIDRTNPKKGKFKPWVSATIVGLPLITIFVFLNTGGNPALKLVYAYITYISWGMINTVSGVPYGALVTSMTHILHERASLISFSTFAGILGSVLTAVLGGPMIENWGFPVTVLIFVVLAFCMMVPIHFSVKERVLHPKRDKVNIRSLWEAIIKNKYLIAFYASFIFVIGTSFALTIGTYFVKWNLGNLELMGIVMICSFLPVMILPLLLPLLIRKFGKRKLYIFGLALAIVTSFIQYFTGYKILSLFLLINGIKLIGTYIPVTMLGMFTADCIEYGAYITGKRNEGMAFSIQAFSTKLGGAVSGSLSVLLLGFFGYNGQLEVQTRATLDGIWLLMSILPAFGLVIALIIFLRFYKLDEKEVERIIAEKDDTRLPIDPLTGIKP